MTDDISNAVTVRVLRPAALDEMPTGRWARPRLVRTAPGTVAAVFAASAVVGAVATWLLLQAVAPSMW